MAQYWLEVTAGYDVSGWGHVLGPAGSPSRDISVVDDAGAPAIRWSSGGTGRIIYLIPGLGSFEDFEIFALCRASATTTSTYTGVGGRLSDSQIDGYFGSFRTGGRLISARYQNDALSLLDIALIGNGVADPLAYHWMGVTASGSSLAFYNWDGAITDKPAARFSTTDATLSGNRPVGLLSIGPTVAGLAKIISIGTDGDPAPTGPVGGPARRRSPLLLTPW